jgi:hypothetical protein
MRTLCAALILAMSVGCYGRVVSTTAKAGASFTDTTWNFVFGAVSSKQKAPECEKGLASVTSKQPWWGVLFVNGLTFNLATPVETTYTCVE